MDGHVHHLLWGSDGTRIHCGKATGWWMECNALGNGETLVPAINVNSLTPATYLNIDADQLHPFMAMVFTDDSGHFLQEIARCHIAHIVCKCFEELKLVKGFALALKLAY